MSAGQGAGSPAASGFTLDRVGPPPGEAPTIVIVLRAEDSKAWAAMADRLASATRCGVAVVAIDASAPAPRVVALALDRLGFERGLLVGDELHAASVAGHLGRVADHRVRGVVLLRPRLFASGWDAREAIGYVRVPIQIVHDEAAPGAAEQAAAVLDEAYCPVDVSAVAGGGPDPAMARGAETLAAIAGFVHTLLDEAGERVPAGG